MIYKHAILVLRGLRHSLLCTAGRRRSVALEEVLQLLPLRVAAPQELEGVPHHLCHPRRVYLLFSAEGNELPELLQACKNASERESSNRRAVRRGYWHCLHCISMHRGVCKTCITYMGTRTPAPMCTHAASRSSKKSNGPS